MKYQMMYMYDKHTYLNCDYFMLENIDASIHLIDKYIILLMTAVLFKLFSVRYL